MLHKHQAAADALKRRLDSAAKDLAQQQAELDAKRFGGRRRSRSRIASKGRNSGKEEGRHDSQDDALILRRKRKTDGFIQRMTIAKAVVAAEIA